MKIMKNKIDPFDLNNKSTKLDLDAKVFADLKDQIRESYKNENYDLHHKLVKERKTLEQKYDRNAKFTIEQKVRMEGSWGASEWRTRKMTYIVNFNELKQYGSFELYSNCDDGYYAEGGLWFQDNELTDYDGIFALPSEIYNQLHKWDLKTDHEGGA